MNDYMRWSLSVAGLFAIMTVNVLAQDQTDLIKARLAAEVQAKIEIVKPLDPQFGFETKIVKGAPYSATAEVETIQMLADGNRIRNKTTRAVYRDSEGRTRREATGKSSGLPTQVFINDPVSSVNYALDVERRIAMKTTDTHADVLINKREIEKRSDEIKGKPQTAEGFKPPTTININGQAMRWEELDEATRERIEAKMRAGTKMVKPTEKPPTAGDDGPQKTVNKEILGQQTIEGVACEGKRATLTIQANTIGNDLPITIVSEEWYSPELQVLVMTKHSDPRQGETIYRLTNINRSEPAHDLFEVPSDYTIRENRLPMKKKLVNEEQ